MLEEIEYLSEKNTNKRFNDCFYFWQKIFKSSRNFFNAKEVRQLWEKNVP